VFAHQEHGNARRQPAQNLIAGVNQVPLARHFVRFGKVRLSLHYTLHPQGEIAGIAIV
jgi:hypothetical protein